MKLKTLFNDNMVLSANQPIKIGGIGKGRVRAELCGNIVEFDAVTDNWEIVLPPMSYGGPYDLKITLNDETLIFKNILIGKVFIAAGQSNMAFQLCETVLDSNKYEYSDNVRFFVIDPVEKENHPNGWVLCNEEYAPRISAVAYHFAFDLYKKHNIPVGVICCHRGASIIESWMSREDCETPEFQLDISLKHPDHTYENYTVWNKSAYLYENAFSLIPPFSVDGVVWYQGESNTMVEECKIYADELSTLIKRWRKDLKNENLPFFVIQIADFDVRLDAGWSGIQKAQALACAQNVNTYLIESRDVCSSADIHPPEKEALGHKVFEKIDSVMK